MIDTSARPSLTIKLYRKTTPESLSPYGDAIVVSNGPAILYNRTCSTNPNPFKPILLKPSWKKVYAQVSAGSYLWSYDTFRHSFGQGLLITNKNGALDMPTTCANVNHHGERNAIGIFIHKGYSSLWRGSKACFTIPPKDWNDFYALFHKGDKGELILIDRTAGKVA